MVKIRVYELARELKVESKALLAKMKDLEIQVPSHQSTLTAAQIDKIRASLAASQPKVVVRRRRKAEGPEGEGLDLAGANTSLPSETAVDAVSAPGNEPEPVLSVAQPSLASSQVSQPAREERSANPEKAESQAEPSKAPPPSVVVAQGTGSAARLTTSPSVEVKAPSPVKAGLAEPVLAATKTVASGDSSAHEASTVAASGEEPVSSAASLAAASRSVLAPQKAAGISVAGQAAESQSEERRDLAQEEMPQVAQQAAVAVLREDEPKKEGAREENAAGEPVRLASEQGVPAEEADADVAAAQKLKKKKSMVGEAALSAQKAEFSDETEGSEDALASSKGKAPIKKRGFTGATIVRRATLEESEATKAREEARQRTSRREDSRGIRVTGIGVNPRIMGQGAEGGAPKRPAPAGGHPHAQEKGLPLEATPFGDKAEGGGNKWAREKTKEKTATGRWVEEDDKVGKALAHHAASSAKRRVSMRDLLDDSVEEAPAFGAPAKKRRTVYTPSAQQRKKDLKRRKDLKTTPLTTPRAAYRVVKIDGSSITIGDLARQLSIKAAELIKKLMAQGLMVTVNQSLDYDSAALIAAEYGFECKNVEKTAEDVLAAAEADQEMVVAESRAPIITVMGHVDHGKTSILDAIRQANVAGGESGGITQHIGAYQVQKDGFVCTFLDTPGHAAFSAMRARGAQVTDIVVLVVAGDDGVMPQTIEAISHAKNAQVPIIVAVNKIDKPHLNLDRVYRELSDHGVQAEDWGGDVQFVKVSALKGLGIEELLDAIKVQAEILELKAPRTGLAEGAIVEAHLDKGRGPVATVMVTKGTLKVGDFIVVGRVAGRVRAMNDYKGARLQEAYPATPVEIIGLPEVPMAGDAVNAVTDEKTAKDVAELRKKKEEGERSGKSVAATLDELLGRVNSEAEVLQLHLIIKADTQGSVEAIAAALEKLATKKVKNTIIHKAVGGINESDLNLAETSQAVILGFNVRASADCSEQAERKGLVLKYFSVIYDLVDTVKSLMAGKLPPVASEVIQGHAQVRDVINVPRVGAIAGSFVTDGKVSRNAHLRLLRNEIVIYSGRVGSLRRFKDDVKEVQHGYECGIAIEGYNDIKVGDGIEAYLIEEKVATLDFGDN